ncbi:hypothetical protein [Demequina flava]|uniref:hypothetical protein n=1 Tax=Demequina flava TaxID=1095025 RepID=UPI00078500AF|nr:hypothetical protein [Demequina flava]
MKRVRMLAAAAAAAVVLAACSSGGDDVDSSVEAGASASPAPSVSEDGSDSGLTPVTNENLDEALAAADLDCDLERSSTVCYVDDVPMPVVLPFDWNVDTEERAEACENGYVATDLEVVGDGATWYAVPNEAEHGQHMIDALAVAGYEASLQPYCP